ncbi:MAG: protein-L-isoaspartate(D-aspartate) O-methyltransferase [Candidatus Rifleibacteriota bacterium]
MARALRWIPVALLAIVVLFEIDHRFFTPVRSESTRKTVERVTEMIEKLKNYGIKDENVLAAMAKVPRHLFIPEPYRNLETAYGDFPCQIGYGQTISQPYIVAYMTEKMKIRPREKVLEIGTGSGYQAAILAELGADVYSVEIIPELAVHAVEALNKTGYSVRIQNADGYKGWREYAPFDVIIVTCAPNSIPDELTSQLKEGGRMIIPVGEEGNAQSLFIVKKRADRIEIISDLPVRFVPMVHGE